MAAVKNPKAGPGRPKDRGPLTAAEKMRLMRDRRRLLFGLGDCVPDMLKGLKEIVKDPKHPEFMAASRLIAERLAPVRDLLDVADATKIEINFTQLEAEEREVERLASAGKYQPLRIVRLPGDAPDESSNGHESPHAGAGAS